MTLQVHQSRARRFTAMSDDPITVAKRLLGQRLVRVIDGQRLAGIIVEVEAYLGAKDRAAHTFGGRRTPRNESMYLPGGHAYVYFTYGAHYCLNVVCGNRDEGVAVLIRAIEPTEGIEQMARNRANGRPRTKPRLSATGLCSGPGKLTQALKIDRSLDGENLRTSDRLFIERVRSRPLPTQQIGVSPRIGMNPAIDHHHAVRLPSGRIVLRRPCKHGPEQFLRQWAPSETWSTRPLRFFLKQNQHISHAKSAKKSETI
jgi:DNA-3-methyladenine glycosylase